MRQLLIVGFLVAGTAAAHAEDVQYDKVLEVMGCARSYMPPGPGAQIPTIGVLCDEQKVIDHVPELMELDLLNKEMTVAYINTHHVTLSGLMTLMAAGIAVPAAYEEHSALDPVHVQGVLDTADDFGHVKPQTIFTFDFDRALYARINWQKFETKNLLKVGKKFAFAPWFPIATAAEDQ